MGRSPKIPFSSDPIRSSWDECNLPDFCHEKRILRLGVESDLKVRRKESNVKVRTPGKIGLLKAMMFDSEVDRCLVGGG